MEAYYKLTQSQLTENEIKKELSKETQKQSSDISTLDDVRDAIGIIKDEVQFLNKPKILLMKYMIFWMKLIIT